MVPLSSVQDPLALLRYPCVLLELNMEVNRKALSLCFLQLCCAMRDASAKAYAEPNAKLLRRQACASYDLCEAVARHMTAS